MNYKKNDRVVLDIEDMGAEGEGIGKMDGFPLFVKDAMIGDRIEARITKLKTLQNRKVIWVWWHTPLNVTLWRQKWASYCEF